MLIRFTQFLILEQFSCLKQEENCKQRKIFKYFFFHQKLHFQFFFFFLLYVNPQIKDTPFDFKENQMGKQKKKALWFVNWPVNLPMNVIHPCAPLWSNLWLSVLGCILFYLRRWIKLGTHIVLCLMCWNILKFITITVQYNHNTYL